ncbi:MAG TPA: YceD family protein [Chthonomonas sp.]|jgi:uncharacterized metal-binding protein YceD (DUF177 family)|uniref:YceD family protein n=1 Tax=Chthonomonas sp. TaxID=2282153 RepID=UPI002B4B2BBB|nr:YceD family protein [Chthonomonas sp.]HLH80646.1 YceD family protein [Chthonomonas sp.]
MRLDISEIIREPGKSAHYTVHEPPLVDEDIECTDDIIGQLDFINTGDALLLRGSCDTCVMLPCSRCCTYYQQPVSLVIEEQFELRAISTGPRSLPHIVVVEEDESPIAGKLFDGNVFDLTEMLRQYILLSQPTQPLPPQQNEMCSLCHRRPEEALAGLGGEQEIEPSGHPAFARLRELLEEQP